jgi:hypothetical protein
VTDFHHSTQTFLPHSAMDFIQPLTKTITRSRKIKFLGDRERLVRKADLLNAISKPIV